MRSAPPTSSRRCAFVARTGGTHARVLVISDGVVTAGADRHDGAARSRGEARRRTACGALDVLAEGGIQDRDSLDALTRAGLPSTGIVIDASAARGCGRRQALARYARSRRGARRPARHSCTRPCWRACSRATSGWCIAELPPEQPLQIELIGAGAEAFETLEAPRPLLERALARAKIDALTAELRALRPDAEAERAQREREIVALSIAQRVRVGLHGAARARDRPRLRALRDRRRTRSPASCASATTASSSSIAIPATALRSRYGSNVPSGRRSRKSGWSDAIATTRLSRCSRCRPRPTKSARRRTTHPQRGRPALRRLKVRAGRAQGRRHRRDPRSTQPRTERAGGPLCRSRGHRGRRARARDGARTRQGRDGESRSARRTASPRHRRRACRSRQRRARASAPRRGDLRLANAQRGARARYRARVGTRWAWGRRRHTRPTPSGRCSCVARPTEAAAEVRVARRVRARPSAQASQALARAQVARARLLRAGRGARRSPRAHHARAVDHRQGHRLRCLRHGWLRPPTRACALASSRAARALRFPKPEGANASVQAGVELFMQEVALAATTRRRAAPGRPRRPAQVPSPRIEDAYSGVLAEVLASLQTRRQGACTRRCERRAHRRPRRRARAGRARRGARGPGRSRARRARLRLDHRSVPGARRPAALRRRAPRAARRRRARARRRHLPAGASSSAPITRRATACSPTRSCARGERAEAFAALERALERSYPAVASAASSASCARTSALDRRGLAARASPTAKRASARPSRAARRSTPTARRRCASCSTGRPTPTTSTSTSTTAAGGHAFYSSRKLAVGRRALRRRHHRLRPRVLHDPRPRARLPLQAAGALLLARPDGLRHGQAPDHRARRQGRPRVRGAPVRDHERPGVRGARRLRGPLS